MVFPISYKSYPKVYQNYTQVVLKKKEKGLDLKVSSAVHRFKKTSWKDAYRMIITLVVDEAVIVSSCPHRAEDVSIANRQSELRH